MTYNADILASYINNEIADTAKTAPIHALIEQRIGLLCELLTLPINNASTKVHRFICEYIIIAPKLLSALHSLSDMSHISDYTQPFLTTAHDFFFDENFVASNNDTFCVLFYKAYLCHRLIEELNDRVAIERALALAPIDTAHMNLIAHIIIGDEEANRLDQQVLIQMELLSVNIDKTMGTIFQTPDAIKSTENIRKNGWSGIIQQWPFLDNDITSALVAE